MKKVNATVSARSNILDYLKKLNVASSNRHEEKYFNNYILSTVMITITFNSSNEYSVYMLCQEKKNKLIYENLFENNFTDNREATNYYNNLKHKMNLYNEKDIKNLITTL